MFCQGLLVDITPVTAERLFSKAKLRISNMIRYCTTFPLHFSCLFCHSRIDYFEFDQPNYR